ncbi:DUF3841 domain-containing protein [Bifidobacterium sp. 82T24]|uniref:DUF3841 domain-containing protein n=1 Tax=Bifidobacterium pluvialisilvae TaxID=2834436 RepID=UPI001C577660|nr:DUF3841 domain-containing protein [Bifidobacterium pluvialisilvae]MBW3087692.1 DUF3841 domain-containing protein [Bifidobacterium pluvialisilvae]
MSLIHLLSVQPRTITERLRTGRAVRCDPAKARIESFADYAWRQYAWVGEQMERHGIARPDGVELPMWAWAAREPGVDFDVDDVTTAHSSGDGAPTIETVEDVLALEVPEENVLLTSYDDWSAWPFISTDGLAMPGPDELAAMDADPTDVLLDRWFDRSDAMSFEERAATWWRCMRPASSLRKPVEMGIDSETGKPYHDWIQATVWEFRLEWLRRVWKSGENLAGTAAWLDWNIGNAPA